MNKLLRHSILLCLVLCISAEYEYVIEMSKKDIQINVDESDSFVLYIKNKTTISSSILVNIHCDPFVCKTQKQFNTTIEFNQTVSSIQFDIKGTEAGHDVIVADVISNSSKINADNAYVRIRVGRSSVWAVLSQVVGWIYFFIWSASFWPQNISNFRRKSVIGFSIDFAALNVTGFLFYTIYNCGLFLSPEIQSEYEQMHPRSEIPVELNDVIYAFHAAFATLITLVQCYIYERGDQRMSILGKLFTGATWTAAAIQLVLCLTHVMSWLTFLYYFSYVKLVVTSVKYAPQAWFNFKRKSTRGWSIAMIYMDFTGGVNGLLQMLFIAYNYNDWETIFGNAAKFGLSIASICYDILFLLQEYVFYPKSGSKLEPPEEEKQYDRKQSRLSVVSIVSVKSEHFTSSALPIVADKRKSVVSVMSTKSVESVKSYFSY